MCCQDLCENDALSPVSSTHIDPENKWRSTLTVVKWSQLSVLTLPYLHLAKTVKESYYMMAKVVTGWEISLKPEGNV